MIKVIIAGSRDFDDYDRLEEMCDKFLSRHKEVEIVSGTARGADRLGEQYAAKRGFTVKRFPADWENHGKSAGHIRNEQMAKYADALIAFWDMKSSGTGSMLSYAKTYGLMIRIVTF